MSFVIKTDTLPNLEEGQVIEITEPYLYGGNAISAGDEAFVWFSGAVQRLGWRAEVLRVTPAAGRQLTVAVRLIARAGPNALGIDHLHPFRDIRNHSVISELARKLCRHALDKVAALTPAEAECLRNQF